MNSRLKEQYLEQGCLEDVLIIDQHLHCGPIGYFYTSGSDFSVVTENLRRQNVRWGIVSNINSYDKMHEENDYVMNVVDRWPQQYRGAIYLNENDCPDIQAEVDRCLETGKFVSFKMHPGWAGGKIDSPFYKQVYAIAGELHFPVLIHTWGEDDIQTIAHMAKKYPTTNFLIGHCGGELEASKKAAVAAVENKNLYLDFTCSWAYAGLLEYLVDAVGANRILFGTDALWNSVDAAIGRVAFAEISDDDKKRILGLNAQELFQIK